MTAHVNMSSIEVTVDGEGHGLYNADLAAAGNTSTVLIPARCTHLAVSVQASGGATARLQVTLDSQAEIAASTETYIDWPDGEVTSETDMALSPAITGLRMVQTGAGASTLKVVCKSRGVQT